MNENGKDFKDEKRKHPRKPCLISVECNTKSRIFTNHIRNISHDGVYIETEEEFSVGEEISLRILAPYKLNQIKNIIGTVVRADTQGIALKFKKDDPVQKALINAFVENI